MGLFDAFGVGGGSLSIVLQFPQVQAGGVVNGMAVFQGGRRAQQITNVTVKLTMTQQVNQNGQLTQKTQDLAAPTVLSGPFTAQPGQSYQFHFQFQIPADSYGTTPGAVSYRIVGNADIDGEVDPGAGVELHVNGQPFVHQGMMPMGGYNQGGYDPAYDKGGFDKGGFDKGGFNKTGGGYDPAHDKGAFNKTGGGYDPANDKGGGFAKQQGGYDPGFAKGKGGGAFAPGAYVLAQWSDGGYYGATVVQAQGDQVCVQWQDGSPASWLHVSQVQAQ
jgi:hypothetical protein